MDRLTCGYLLRIHVRCWLPCDTCWACLWSRWPRFWLNVGCVAAVGQVFLMAYLTWWELSWDVMVSHTSVQCAWHGPSRRLALHCTSTAMGAGGNNQGLWPALLLRVLRARALPVAVLAPEPAGPALPLSAGGWWVQKH
jgi:hypothetical protein